MTMAVTAGLAVIALGASTSVAQAGDALTPEDSKTSVISETVVEDTLAEVVPEVLAETIDSEHVSVSNDGSVEVDPNEIADGLGGDVQVAGVDFSIDYAQSVGVEGDGLATLEGEDSAVEAVVQTTGYGVRVLTVISDASAPSEYQYTFDVPEGTEMRESAAGFSLISDTGHHGTLQEPWAVDAEGISIPTYYSWNAGVLTQHVDLSAPDISFPVVADPAWGYTVMYSLKKKPKANKKLLKKCFNCYFPVNGAPKKYPAIGQLLPLKVWIVNFECIYRREFSSTGYFGFQFDATKRHVDGLGSNISFEFLRSGDDTYLYVSAYIMRLGEVSEPYMKEAKKKWKAFAANLNKA